MLERKSRLLSDKDFDRVFAKGKFGGSATVTVKAVSNGLGVSRFGFVVGTKVSKRAVERNKAKRRMREIIRKNTAFVKDGFDVVFVAKKEVLTMDFAVLERAMAQLCHKIGVLK